MTTSTTKPECGAKAPVQNPGSALPAYWLKHECSLPAGHDGPHVCILCEQEFVAGVAS